MKYLKRIFESNHFKGSQIDMDSIPKSHRGSFISVFLWIEQNVKAGDTLKYTYCESIGFSDHLKKFDNLFLEKLVYLESSGKKIYFLENVVDNSGASDCDVRYYYKRISVELLNQLKADVASITL